MNYPSYLNLSREELEKRAGAAWARLNPCCVCPRECGVNRQLKMQNAKYLPDRQAGQMKRFGFCGVGAEPIISSCHPHFGEERCLVGKFGSGTIFFTSCNLACVYCQNFEISQLRIGKEVSSEELACMMVNLQEQGCHNLNLVSPTIYVPQILKSLLLAVPKGFHRPLVYNSGGYDHAETLKLLDGIVDIYMPDIKYSNNKIAQRYSLAPNYREKVRLAIKEMQRQVGNLVIDEKTGLAVKGLLVRHLVLPNNLAGTKKVMEFLAQEISRDTYVNLMDQYYPYHKAYLYPKLSRKITTQEYEEAMRAALDAGLHRFDKKRST
ncbi:MAG: radical SAM protein [Candidatus Cloacimonetes bacterium]|nr:radical SAM protein [Candidatus Cloacimonadota bacterium]